MSVKNTTLRYGSVAMMLHWLIALLLTANIVTGFVVADGLDDADPLQATLLRLHEPTGLIILVLSVMFLGWKLINPIPRLPVGMSMRLRILARGTHYTLYFLIIAVPLAGWALVSTSRTGRPISFFGLFQWPNIPLLTNLTRPDRHQGHILFGMLHPWMAYVAFALVVLHVSAALYHHIVRRDDVLIRMLPGATIPTSAD